MPSHDVCLSVSLSVCLSYTRRYSVDTAEHVLKVFYRQVAPSILVLPYQTGWQYSDGNAPNGGVECKEYEKITIFYQHLASTRK